MMRSSKLTAWNVLVGIYWSSDFGDCRKHERSLSAKSGLRYNTAQEFLGSQSPPTRMT